MKRGAVGLRPVQEGIELSEIRRMGTCLNMKACSEARIQEMEAR